MTVTQKPSLLNCSDIKSIQQLVYLVYKDAYASDWIYKKEELKNKIRSKELTFLGIKKNGMLVGLLCMSYPHPTQYVIELNKLIIHPAYRAYQNGSVIRSLIMESKKIVNNLAEKTHVCVLLTAPIVKHQLSQKLQLILGLYSVGIAYCTRPDEHELHKILKNKTQSLNLASLKRNDQVISIYCYKNKLSIIDICLPRKYFLILESLLPHEKLSIFNSKKSKPLPNNDVNLQIKPRQSFVTFKIDSTCNYNDLVKDLLDIINKNYRVIHIYINVGNYDNIELIEKLDTLGLIFSYFIPCYFGAGGHALVLQYLNNLKPTSKSKQFYDPKMQLLHKQLLGV